MTTTAQPMPELLEKFVHGIYSRLQPLVGTKDVPPATILINSRAMAIEQLPMMLDSQEGKDVTSMFVRAAAEIMGADAAVMVSECWAVNCDSGEEREALRQQYGSSLEHYPEEIRRDTLVIMVETKPQTWHCESVFIPAKDGQPRQLGPLEIKAVDSSAGRFVNFLPR